MRSVALTSFCLLLCSVTSAQDAPADQAAERLIQTLRGDDVAARRAALSGLRSLGESARPALRRALRDSDPEVRFYVRQLLSAQGGKLVRGLREVLEHAAGSGDGRAIKTFEALLQGSTPSTPGQLILVARRSLANAGRDKPVLAVVALDLLSEVVARHPNAAHAKALATLLDLDAKSAFHALTMAFAALPYPESLAALRAVSSGGATPARVRAALVLAHITPPKRSLAAHATLVPLLTHPAAEVRLAAVQALDLLDLPQADSLIPVARLATDPAPRVAAEAIRVAGERKLAVAQDPCQALAKNSKAPIAVRKQAIRTLGLLGNPTAAGTLKGLTGPSVARELRILAAWALGAVRAPDALEVLLPLIRSAELGQEQALFFGVARSGGGAARRALFAQIVTPNPMPTSKEQVIALRGRVARALRATPALGDPTTAQDLAELARQSRALRSDLPGPTVAEIQLAVEALAARGDDESRTLIGAILLDPSTPTLAKGTCLTVLGQVGLPAGAYPLKLKVVKHLEQEIRRGRRTRASAADALAKVDPAAARTLLRSQRLGNTSSLRDMARSLARAGDPSLIARYALPLSRRAVRDATPGQRVDRLNNVGIDLLYAQEYREALMVFRRMTWSQPEHSLAAYNAACAYALSNRPEPALRCLRQSVFALGYKNPTHMAADADLTVLRTQPRFQRLLRQLRMADETQMAVPVLELPRSGEPKRGGD